MVSDIKPVLICFYSNVLDHMEGLDNLLVKLNSSNSVRINHRIYCSAITKAFLIQKFKLVMTANVLRNFSFVEMMRKDNNTSLR